MFCPKCGTAFAEGGKKCENCGYELPAESTAPTPEIGEEQQPANSAPVPEKTAAAKRLPLGIIFFVLAALVLLMSLYAAHCVVTGGMEIGSIESVGGKTLEEAYYQELATVYAGYAAMIRATGIFFSSILAYIGLKN